MPSTKPLPPPLRWPAAAIRLAMKLDPLRLFEHGYRTVGDIVRYDNGPMRYVVLARPQDIERILLRNYRNYAKAADHPVLNRMLGQGVIMTNGDTWRQQRKALAPAFQPRQLARLVAAAERTTKEAIEGWARRRVTEIDVYHALSVLTREVVGGALFGTRSDELGGEIGAALDIMVERANIRADRPWNLSVRYPTPRNRRFFRAVDRVDRFVHRLIEDRRAGRGQSDILTMLMSAHEESGLSAMDDTELRDQILNLFLAGFETTASALCWVLMLLSRYPDAARRIADEADDVIGDAPMEYEHLAQLQYLGWVLNESMRLYPPIWTNERVAQQDDEIAGYHIPRGTMVAASIWLLHHNPDVWEQPACFDPERFRPERVQQRPKHAFIPFGLGPRTCVGNHLATMQSKVMIATLVRTLAIDVHPVDAKPDAAITLRPAGDLRGRLRPR